MKLIIAGSRSFGTEIDHRQLDLAMEKYIGKVAEIVSGCAPGADLAGEHWAHVHGVPVRRFRADWNAFGKRAGILRNQEMADYADAAMVMWDGASRGSKHMIEEMKKRGKPVTVCPIHGVPLAG